LFGREIVASNVLLDEIVLSKIKEFSE